MDKYIAELIEIDAKNKEEVRKVEGTNQELFDQIKKDEQELSDKLWKKANSQIKKIRETKHKNLEEEFGDVDSRIKKYQKMIDKTVDKNYQIWLNELYEKVVE